MQSTHDIILIGGGCSSLQWLEAYTQLNSDHQQRILIIDKDATPPERTWCFWSDRAHRYEALVSHRWSRIRFASPLGEIVQRVDPYSYQYISGRDFFDAAASTIKNDARVEKTTATVLSTEQVNDVTVILTTEGKFAAPMVYSSIPDVNKLQSSTKGNGSPELWQHFQGWFIETEQDSFDSETITLMDFRTEQKDGAVFFYVLPFSGSRALVECTVFGKGVWSPQQYGARLKEYVGRFVSGNYRITHTENGRIPMTMTDFKRFSFDGTQSLGTAAGMVKPSTGYMFMRSLRSVEASVNEEEAAPKPERFAFYDALLLGIIKERPGQLVHIMHQLFSKNDFIQVFRFLDEQTSLKEDISMLKTLPYLPFMKQLVKYYLKPGTQ